GIDPYVKNGQIFRCPSDTIKRYEAAGKYGQISYGMNGFMNGYETKSMGPRMGDVENVGSQSIAAISSPAKKVLVGDIYKASGYAGPRLRPNKGSYVNFYYRWPLDMEFDESTA